jgi:NAD(P)-dependent dehydrogenase (short-subunit alcohol dehydrogenase family)
VADPIRSHGAEAIANDSDVSTAQGSRDVIATTIEHFGRIDLLVNNAGICGSQPFEDATLDDFEMHQRAVAVERNRPVENRGVAVRLEDPEPDFAALARCGVDGIGPIKDPVKLLSALAQAVERVARSETVLIDVSTDAPG